MESALSARREAIVGMAIFVGSDAVAFGALLFTFVGLRLGAESWQLAVEPSMAFGLVMTGALAVVSGSLVAGRWACRSGREGRARLATGLALLAAVAFVVCQVVEIRALAAAGLVLGSGPADSFYVITGYHGVHVAGGALYLAWITLRGDLGQRLPPASLYWHFVDALWLLLFGLFYLS